MLLQSVASADEGLFALIARELLWGHLPYTTVWETKPPLLFGLLAGAFVAFGTSPFALRLATDAAIFATALALFSIGASLGRDGRAVGSAAAVLYAALTLSDGASSALAETFYAPFVAVPIAAALRARSRPNAGARLTPFAGFGLGACLGCAVLVKESAALEAAFAALVVLRAGGARVLAPLAAGALVALGLTVLPYAAGHALGSFWDANYAAVARRALVPVPDATPLRDVLRAQAFGFFPVSLLVLGIPWFLRRGATERRAHRLMLLALAWGGADIATVCAIREFLGDHFIPLMAPAALAGALVLVEWSRNRSRAFVPAVLALALLAHCAYQFVLAAPVAYARVARHDATFGDTTAGLAAYLSAHARPGSTLYVADDRTMLYVLARFSPPTRYAYSAHLVDPYQETIAGVDGRAEVRRILAGRPSYVVRDLANRAHEDPRVRDVLDRILARSYTPAFALGSHVIYASSGKN